MQLAKAPLADVHGTGGIVAVLGVGVAIQTHPVLYWVARSLDMPANAYHRLRPFGLRTRETREIEATLAAKARLCREDQAVQEGSERMVRKR